MHLMAAGATAGQQRVAPVAPKAKACGGHGAHHQRVEHVRTAPAQPPAVITGDRLDLSRHHLPQPCQACGRPWQHAQLQGAAQLGCGSAAGSWPGSGPTHAHAALYCTGSSAHAGICTGADARPRRGTPRWFDDGGVSALLGPVEYAPGHAWQDVRLKRNWRTHNRVGGRGGRTPCVLHEYTPCVHAT